MIEAELAPWRAQLDRLTRTVLGAAGQLLLISRSHEARLGNLVAEAMLASWAGRTMPDGSTVR